ncbi:hypothetical protein RvY_04543 [Ramazzottius varieornatus]|uniref:Calcineurin-like phosphoesterase domain-containing protein n=1 Tax=Ramazzottius varieornatus TaxID=947166 RepID=A0A1D1URY5_RAMVA|nr:hypothetical protein RvY_04543 [Ramazzottius varieornatus]
MLPPQLRRWHHSRPFGFLFRAFCLVTAIVIVCEHLIYYSALWKCSWPTMDCGVNDPNNMLPRKAFLLADTHLLTRWSNQWDRTIREWHMERSFQTANFLLQPDLVFVLGDVLNNGQNTYQEDFDADVQRFQKMFASQAKVICAVGNHDIGFHYRVHPYLLWRFEQAFNASAVQLYQDSGISFVILNSVAFEMDKCEMCEEAEEQLLNVSKILRETGSPRPFVLQHYPMYRESDEICTEEDAAPEGEKTIHFREKWECLSKNATSMIMATLNPRAVFGGHTHHSCYRQHENGVEEWSVSSFNRRFKKYPSFLMVSFCPDTFAVRQCFLPDEYTLLAGYVVAVAVVVITACWCLYTLLRFKGFRLKKFS